jgi:hypothetical protein
MGVHRFDRDPGNDVAARGGIGLEGDRRRSRTGPAAHRYAATHGGDAGADLHVERRDQDGEWAASAVHFTVDDLEGIVVGKILVSWPHTEPRAVSQSEFAALACEASDDN